MISTSRCIVIIYFVSRLIGDFSPVSQEVFSNLVVTDGAILVRMFFTVRGHVRTSEVLPFVEGAVLVRVFLWNRAQDMSGLAPIYSAFLDGNAIGALVLSTHLRRGLRLVMSIYNANVGPLTRSVPLSVLFADATSPSMTLEDAQFLI